MDVEKEGSKSINRRAFLGLITGIGVVSGLEVVAGYPNLKRWLGPNLVEPDEPMPHVAKLASTAQRELKLEPFGLRGPEREVVTRTINEETQRAIRCIDAKGNPYYVLANYPEGLPGRIGGEMRAFPHFGKDDDNNEYVSYQNLRLNSTYLLRTRAPENLPQEAFPYFNSRTLTVDWVDQKGNVLAREEKPFYQIKDGERLEFDEEVGGYWIVGVGGTKRDFIEIYEPTLTDKQLEVKLIRLKLVEIYKRFGIEIPYGPDPRFQAQAPYIEQTESSDLGMELVEEGQTATLTLEEVTIIEEALKKVPSPGALAQLILPFRYRPKSSVLPEIPHGVYFGRRWRSWLEKGLYPCSEDPDEPFDEEAAIILFLPQGFNPQKPFPSSDFHYFSPGIQLSEQPEEIYRRNQGEHLKQMLVHELGHGLDDQVGLRTFPMPRQHCEHLGKLSICRFENMDSENRIYQTFAVVNHWRLASGKEIYLSCGGSWSFSSGGETLGWMRDYRIWGYPPKMRISNSAIEANISETFAEFWMASILFPQLLTYEERIYFNNIHRGLGRDPEEFLQKVANQPEVLLRGTKFELSIGY